MNPNPGPKPNPDPERNPLPSQVLQQLHREKHVDVVRQVGAFGLGLGLGLGFG